MEKNSMKSNQNQKNIEKTSFGQVLGDRMWKKMYFYTQIYHFCGPKRL